MDTIKLRLTDELKKIRDGGLFKAERVIQSQQSAKITVNDKSVINFEIFYVVDAGAQFS